MVELRSVNKQFGKLEVLKGLNLSLNPGLVTAIVGHNGSGKTTLIKIILGLTRRDKGDVFFDGNALNGEADYRSRIGYMPQLARFPENLSGTDVIALLKDLRGENTASDLSLADAFGISSELDKPFRTLSGGTKQKISAMVALLFSPEFLILDEPTAGLDPLSSSILKDRILAEKEKGTTVLLTSHIMSEVEELADIVVYLVGGAIRYEGPIDELRKKTGEAKLERAIARMMVLNGETS